MDALRATQDAHLKPMFERMHRADAIEAIGIVDDITNFDHAGELSTSIELKPWRWANGPLEQGSLYIRKQDAHRQEQRDIRDRLPRFGLVRVSVRPDVDRREDGSLWTACSRKSSSSRPRTENCSFTRTALEKSRPPKHSDAPPSTSSGFSSIYSDGCCHRQKLQ